MYKHYINTAFTSNMTFVFHKKFHVIDENRHNAKSWKKYS